MEKCRCRMYWLDSAGSIRYLFGFPQQPFFKGSSLQTVSEIQSCRIIADGLEIRMREK